MSNERTAFLKALEENEDDTTTRMVYADWLDENGEHEEADRQRKWPTAKAWLVQFCKDHNSHDQEERDEEVEFDPEDEDTWGDWGEWVITYETLVQLGRDALENADESGIGFSCGNNMTMGDALMEHSREFWANWSIVTGIAVPPDADERTYYRCAC